MPRWKRALFLAIFLLLLLSVLLVGLGEGQTTIFGVVASVCAGGLVYIEFARPASLVRLLNQVINRRRRGFQPQDGPILFVTSNGAGLGHLTRVAAVASNLTRRDFHVVTMSSGYLRAPIPKGNITYFPSYGALGIPAAAWEKHLEKFLGSMVGVYRPSQIVFDGTSVYTPVTTIARRHQIPLTWIQRGCWKQAADRGSVQRHNAAMFVDRVILPGDYGCDETVDLGPGVEPIAVSPVTIVSKEDLLQRDVALKELGLDPTKKYVLAQLGAGVINEVGELMRVVVDCLPDSLELVTTRNPLKESEFGGDVNVVQAYPIAKYFNAFEFSIQAAGYNSVQEAVSLGLPTVFVPNLETKTDDQARRALTIEGKGYGCSASTTDELRRSVEKLCQEPERLRLSGNLATVRKANGAKEIARILENVDSITSVEVQGNG